MNNSSKIYIIAEAGVNHNGSLARAKEMVHVAAEAGADAVKFQTFKAEHLVNQSAPKADYQMQTTDQDESQYDMLKRLELDMEAHCELALECAKRRIEFLSTPFDLPSLYFLIAKMSLKRIKIASGEITNAPFLIKIAEAHKPVILSTGMSTIGEIESALSVLAFGYLDKREKPSSGAFLSAYASKEGQAVLRKNVTLLHCTTEYPAPYDEVNLNCMDTMRKAFQLPVGYSDHTEGIAIPIAAAACGAAVIEKHFTLDQNLPGPDHKASLEPDGLEKMIAAIRNVEKAMGNGVKIPKSVEIKNRDIVRKSLTVSEAIKKGDIFSENNLTAKRPGNGVSPYQYWSFIGCEADIAYSKDEKVRL